MNNNNEKIKNILKQTPQFEPLCKDPITRVQLVRFAGASGDFNPLHTVEDVGIKAGMGGVIAHGMLIMGFAAQAVASWVPLNGLRSLKVRFLKISRPGDTITVTGEVVDTIKKANDEVAVCEFKAVNQGGEAIISGRFEVDAALL